MSTLKPLPEQPSVNVGTAGHVDHGKSTLVYALTGIWTPRHSEELRRGITIRIGYADVAFCKCPQCEPPECYTTYEVCPKCGSETKFLRSISFVDCPGHEVLMTTMLAGSAVVDGAILVIAADEPVPRPQTREHLYALQVIGVKNIVIVQNKIDLVTREQCLENYQQIVKFTKDTIAEGSPIIPTSAQHRTNLDAIIEAIEKYIPTPQRDPAKPPMMHIVRSFDVNKPGLPIRKMVGGVIGGAIIQGELGVGDEIEIRPGIKVGDTYEPLYTEIVSLYAGGRPVEKARCGGLVGVGTRLDPFLTKADRLLGNVVGKPDNLPPVLSSFTMDVSLFEFIVGTKEMIKVDKIAINEPIALTVGTATTLAVVTSIRDNIVEVSLKRPVCVERGSRVSISRNVARRWRLIGYGVIL